MFPYDIIAERIDSSPAPLSLYRGKVLLIVNTASRCGFTPQYAALQTLYAKYQNQGFEVLAFPSNQFGSQEPGSNTEIAQFCDLSFRVTFPLFARIEVNGPNTHPLYRFLKSEKRGIFGLQRISWNFTKFLVDRSGRVIARFAPSTKPEKLAPAIEKLLAIQSGS